MTVGHLASRRSAALPIASALGGMVVLAVLYALVIPAGAWSHGWFVPMATDTAFATALIAVMGARVPMELRICPIAAAIVDDIGATVVVAVFYSREIHPDYLAAAAAVVVALWLLSRSRVSCCRPTSCWASRCGHASTRAASTLRWPACYLLCSFRRGRMPTWPPR
jgi:Na+:H+ antiporter, NhaA family